MFPRLHLLVCCPLLHSLFSSNPLPSSRVNCFVCIKIEEFCHFYIVPLLYHKICIFSRHSTCWLQNIFFQVTCGVGISSLTAVSARCLIKGGGWGKLRHLDRVQTSRGGYKTKTACAQATSGACIPLNGKRERGRFARKERARAGKSASGAGAQNCAADGQSPLPLSPPLILNHHYGGEAGRGSPPPQTGKGVAGGRV